ncbi:hypothetical protein [Salinimonas lutimaris]|uniref:hypothetical protein n=1 Tax=Salinimonas lutimaris TaxID=914153 RepID=UPI0010C0EF95|nr:hypothetical protein [Salinimonas lutimaris]
MNFKQEVTLLRAHPDNRRVLAITVNTPADGTLASSSIYEGVIEEINKSADCFWVNSTILDIGVTSSNHYWIGDNEGHIYTTKTLSKVPLDNEQDVEFGFDPNRLPTVQQYRFSTFPINAIWCDETLTIIADEAGTFWHIQDGEFTSHSACKDPLAFFGQQNDIYVYGQGRQLWHFNGSIWSQIELPDMGLDFWQISGATLVNENTYLAVTDYGFVFKGNAQEGFNQIKAPKKYYSGITTIDDRVFVSIPEEGVYEVKNITATWEIGLIHNSRIPLSLQAIGEPSALYTTNAFEAQKGYFVVLIPGDKFAEKKRVFAWEIGND